MLASAESAVAYPLTYLFVLGGYILTERAGAGPTHALPMTAVDKRRKGLSRPCCWPGCPHR